MPTPYRRCVHMDEKGTQCDKWFPATTSEKLCNDHRLHPNEKEKQSEEQKVRYIDLVNDERKYCYHFLDGTAQEQKQTLIFEFKDDEEGTVFDKIAAHTSFLEKVIEDVKARLHSARAVNTEKLENLSEEERKELRKIKIERAVKGEKKKREKKDKIEKTKSDWKDKLSKLGASLDMDEDAMLEKFKELARKKKESQENATE